MAISDSPARHQAGQTESRPLQVGRASSRLTELPRMRNLQSRVNRIRCRSCHDPNETPVKHVFGATLTIGAYARTQMNQAAARQRLRLLQFDRTAQSVA